MFRKRAVFLAFALLVLLLFGGCSLFRPESELFVPPGVSEDEQALRDAFHATCGEDVGYKSPIGGKYHSAFVIEDLDADGEREAMVFYAKDMFTEQICIALFEYRSPTWCYVDTIESDCTVVESVEISDMDGNGSNELLLLTEHNEEKRMSLFAFADEPFGVQCLLEETAYSALRLLDLDGDGNTEIFTVSCSAVTGPQTSMRRMTDNGVRRLDWRKLDKDITSFGELYVRQDAQESVFYVDAFKSDGTMITEVVCWNEQSDTLTVPLLDTKTQSTTQTARAGEISCMDVNADGAVEIPCRSALRFSEIWRNGTKSDESFYQTDWCVFRDGKLTSVRKTLLEPDTGWMFTVPEQWEGRFTVCVYPADRKWNFYETDARGATVYLGSVKFDAMDSTYTPLCTQDEHTVSVYGINQASALYISEAQFGQMFAHIGQ